MCHECWVNAGKPREVTEMVIRAAEAIDEVYVYSFVGGNLHVVIDDWNVDDEDLAFCRAEAIPENLHEASKEWIKKERECLGLLEGLTVAQRAAALALQSGYIDKHGSEVPRKHVKEDVLVQGYCKTGEVG